MRSLFKTWSTRRFLAVGLILAALVVPATNAMPSLPRPPASPPNVPDRPQPSGIYDFRDDVTDLTNLSLSQTGQQTIAPETTLTECPQAGLSNQRPRPLDQRAKDAVEHASERGDDIRVNQDYTCFPQNETTIAINPKTPRNILAGANDYRLGTGSSGFYASTDGGKSWYDGIIPFPSAPAAQSRGEGFVISGGDPVAAFDRDGVAYFAMIAFFRGDDTNGIFVTRSTNGGFTWSRACVPAGASDATAVCGGPGDVRQPGDGRVAYEPDTDNTPNGSVPFNDKEWMTTGPRPRGVEPVCFTPITRAATTCDKTVVGVDRIYVTWTAFTATSNHIYMSFSDDQARSWSPPKKISGNAPFCIGGATPGECSFNQASVPTVNPHTGHLYVAFVNGNSPDEGYYLLVRSKDGGATFEGPFFITSAYNVNFPRAGLTRPDCAARGAQAGRIVYTNSCFRSNQYGNVVVDKRAGAFADDLYLVMADNRNGTPASSNSDIFLFKSTDGGTTWIGPTRVNDDRSVPPPNRDCGRTPGTLPSGDVVTPCGGVIDYGSDQWWPWVDIGEEGQLNIAFHDRRLDINSTEHEWPGSRSRPGNYLVWHWGAQCRVKHADSRECLARAATIITQPTAPVDPGADPVPGQGPTYLGSLRNFQISDVPSNFDYSFRAGLFAGDYESIVVHGDRAYAIWTDARNGRSSQKQPGRNPICEQSDVFLDIFSASRANGGGLSVPHTPFLTTPCPGTRR